MLVYSRAIHLLISISTSISIGSYRANCNTGNKTPSDTIGVKLEQADPHQTQSTGTALEALLFLPFCLSFSPSFCPSTFWVPSNKASFVKLSLLCVFCHSAGYFFSSPLLRNGGPRSLTSERVLIWMAVRLGPHSFCSSVPRTSPRVPEIPGTSPRPDFSAEMKETDGRLICPTGIFVKNKGVWVQAGGAAGGIWAAEGWNMFLQYYRTCTALRDYSKSVRC